MSYSGSGDTGGAWRNDGGVPPHASIPGRQPELFRGVLTRRVFAFPDRPRGAFDSGDPGLHVHSPCSAC